MIRASGGRTLRLIAVLHFFDLIQFSVERGLSDSKAYFQANATTTPDPTGPTDPSLNLPAGPNAFLPTFTRQPGFSHGEQRELTKWQNLEKPHSHAENTHSTPSSRFVLAESELCERFKLETEASPHCVLRCIVQTLWCDG